MTTRHDTTQTPQAESGLCDAEFSPPQNKSGSLITPIPNKSAWLITLGLLSIIIAATIAVYSPILFNFFVGDDFGHLTWLKVAIVHPELIWKNFYSSWLDGTTTLFYRPLISVFMVTDYLMWGTNGLGFHITNLVFHLASTILIFFISRHLLAASLLSTTSATHLSTTSGAHAASGAQAPTATTNTEAASRSFINKWLYPLSTSLIFGLYPLHTEAVSWITGRVDVIVTAFYLASFWCYINWRSATRYKFGWLAGTLITLVLGLMSKEMAVTLPVLFAAYEFLFLPGKNLISSAFNSLKATSIFWGVIAAYFVLRRYALGTFVGGYDDSLFFVPDIKDFIYLWVHGLRMFIVPLNKSLMGAHHVLTRVWEIHLALLAVTFAAVVWFNRNLTKLLLFNFAFLAIAFVPVYKVFNISDDLQGNRLAHVATIALSLLIALCFAPVRRDRANKMIPIWQVTLATTFCICCFAVLWTNNQAWATAGREANAIRAGLDKLYSQIAGDPQVLLVGLPDNIDGAYIMRNALQGMTRTPQMHRDTYHATMLNQYEQTIPIGFMKESIREAGDGAKIFWWNPTTKLFDEVKLGASNSGNSNVEKLDLKSTITDQNGRWLPDGTFETTTVPGRFGRPEVKLNLGNRSSFDTNFVAITLRYLEGYRTPIGRQGADLLYSHRITNDFSLPRRTHGDLSSTLDREEVILPLRSLPEWAFRGTAGKLLLLLPRDSQFAIESISIITPQNLMPNMTFKDSGLLNRKGEIHLSQKAADAQKAQQAKSVQSVSLPPNTPNPQAQPNLRDEANTVYVDARNVPGASSAVIEVTRGNLYFEFQNMSVPSKVIMNEFKLPAQGSLTFKRDMFPSAGIYEARAWALDGNGQKLGVAGDHIVLSVDD